ncbi:MAG: adenosylcobinamide-GDP ribazoletransferase [Okeania sp. SIO2C2]|uniref:Adenosylcobinamide-GDP ribazoletransferase n=1 Tax=Okeania hirsuta TaxID=1458930 RepID=A0A3N6NWD2_9CYAN|nr:adenosylcobinamide-GDP ribazoletransferase [Okeania sp. SIO2C2]NES77045.1 adenosylcobinamide-GDP ribazoletransferase [Okeania sp. SIO1H4]NES89385.1 adenosylcobinamide-GDP ribazoletransferase [Okeania sp. SIO2B9]NET13356.1 adenosylcobinamide-GDP ribazoletransferase [Okeania sp. SIO1H6]NET18540.1 adenosylcobinamide-GDP ribazoletransferase [Okeania sp. SIO1H5]NET76661.1 adenosylcobinamide-GDP ribazoletransferase [Okeania sp. SIO1F9]NET94883.1 adenosylcobinamide-GDP ribazoletransferase [Okeani
MLLQVIRKTLTKLSAGIAFYTCLPIPHTWNLDFNGIARFAPLIGLIVGGILGVIDLGLQILGMPILTRSAVAIISGIILTGGLHLDGVMDTADGLAVPDQKRRLEVMSDSATGAFGAMAAIALLLLKITALTDLDSDRFLILMGVAGWGRWGQLVAIARYPYLKPTGKGAFHKEAKYSIWDFIQSLLLLVSLSGIQILLNPESWLVASGMAIGGIAIALLTGAWFNRCLGGHTGDTYGAVVEWTEALLLCLLVTLE